RLLGGFDWWRYGVEQLSALARERGTALALLPRADREEPRREEASTMPAHELAALLDYFRAAGRENLRALLQHLARHVGAQREARPARPLPQLAGYLPGHGAIDLELLARKLVPDRPMVPVVFYRALLGAGDTAVID